MNNNTQKPKKPKKKIDFKINLEELHFIDKEAPPDTHLSAQPFVPHATNIFATTTKGEEKKLGSNWDFLQLDNVNQLGLAKHTLTFGKLTRQKGTVVKCGILLYGGIEGNTTKGNIQDKLYFLGEDRRWLELCVVADPFLRFSHSAVMINECYLTIFGGISKDMKVRNDVLIFDMKTKSANFLTTVGEAPSPRYQHTAVALGNYMLVFGGTDTNKNFLNDMYALNLKEKTWTKIKYSPESQIPSVRACHTSTVISNSRFVMYGGLTNDNAILGDIWIFKFEADTLSGKWKKVTNFTGESIPALYGHATALVQPNMLVTVGGYTVPSMASSSTAVAAADRVISPKIIALSFENVIQQQTYDASLGVSSTPCNDLGRAYHSLAVWDNALFVAGGKPTNEKMNFFNDSLVVRYKPSR